MQIAWQLWLGMNDVSTTIEPPLYHLFSRTKPQSWWSGMSSTQGISYCKGKCEYIPGISFLLPLCYDVSLLRLNPPPAAPITLSSEFALAQFDVLFLCT